ncbi:hypothetical protein L7F22_005291 [Adiantum nelumboides]|nr:hypothetical protein [Adiantum nelumboides]
MAAGQCFECGAQGHQITECPRRRAPRQNQDPNQKENQNQNQRSSLNRSRPCVGLVPDILGSEDADASSELCRSWGQVRDHRSLVWDHQSLVFFDPGARAKFITPHLTEKMGIKTDEMGPAYTTSMAAPGHEVAVTPLIGKLRLYIQGYVDHEEFYIMPLEGCDVLLGIPWFYNHKALLDSFNKTVTLEITDEDFVEPYDALACGEHPDSYSLKDGHKGIDSTIKVLEMYFFWPSLRKDTESFVRSCLICQRVKYDIGKAYGLLQPLPIPTAPWESIAMDFIFELPKTSSGNEGIWTIVDRFNKEAHFIPVRKQITTEQMAKTFLFTVFKYHGMARSIVSDRDSCMIGLFWPALWLNLHSTLRFSYSYHLQTDGQSEIVNSVVLDLLKCYVSDNPAQ